MNSVFKLVENRGRLAQNTNNVKNQKSWKKFKVRNLEIDPLCLKKTLSDYQKYMTLLRYLLELVKNRGRVP